MSPTATQNDPKNHAEDDTATLTERELVTYRIEIDATGRTLLQGFHLAANFWPTDDALKAPWFAEFGDPTIATEVIRKLRYGAPLVVRRKDWGELAGQPLLHLCCRVEKTGAHTNMMFWNPASRAARALMGAGREGRS